MSSSTRKMWNRTTSENITGDVPGMDNGSDRVVLFEAARFKNGRKTDMSEITPSLSWHGQFRVEIRSAGSSIPVDGDPAVDCRLPHTRGRFYDAAPPAAFCQVVALPRGTQPQNIRAIFKDGVLEITILLPEQTSQDSWIDDGAFEPDIA